jgi:hypothetical protein
MPRADRVEARPTVAAAPVCAVELRAHRPVAAAEVEAEENQENQENQEEAGQEFKYESKS